MSFKKVVLMLMAVVMVFAVIGSGTTAEAAKKKYTEKDLRLMSAIIYCEAGGQCYAGKLAVGCVVMNRKRSSAFPNTIEKVIRQPYQFGPVRTGKFSVELKKYRQGAYNSGARKECKKAAKAVLSGQDYVKRNGKKINMRKYHFFNGNLPNAKLRISGHEFK